ncbi:ABC transporter permease [Flavobacteriaceae bacterium Ap0902]|nr:ABC transporter permease [Flavobacteriaceae bacterium Ap0902]
MKELLVFIKKEFKHVFRDRRTLLIMFGLPFIQILLFGYALTSEVKNANIVVMDLANDETSQDLTERISATPNFIVERRIIPQSKLDAEFKKGTTKAVVIIPQNFETDLYNTRKATIQVIADATEPNVAKTIHQYIQNIVSIKMQDMNQFASQRQIIEPEVRMLFNEEMNGSISYVPGVLAMVLMIISTALTSVAVVREKELGTMEILLVSPFNPLMVLVAKTIPYLVLSLVNFVFIIFLSITLLDVPFLGNSVLLFMETLLFILTSLAFGLVISNIAQTQQQALLISMMGLLLPTVIFTGFIFPIENMPWPLQWISNLVPAKWYYFIVKKIMLKGLGFSYVWQETLILLGMTVTLLILAVKNFKIRLS